MDVSNVKMIIIFSLIKNVPQEKSKDASSMIMVKNVKYVNSHFMKKERMIVYHLDAKMDIQEFVNNVGINWDFS